MTYAPRIPGPVRITFVCDKKEIGVAMWHHCPAAGDTVRIGQLHYTVVGRTFLVGAATPTGTQEVDVFVTKKA